MSLTDELMEIAESLKDSALRWGNAQKDQPLRSESRRAAVLETHEWLGALRTRLSAIETELNDLRKLQYIDERGDSGPQNGAKSLPRHDLQYVDGLPCCQMSDWDGETGG